MKRIFSLLVVVLATLSTFAKPELNRRSQNAEHTRMIVTTDIGGSDPDDTQSLVHLLVMLNEVELEGIISQHAWVPYGTGADSVIERVIGAYEKVLPNLRVHDKTFPDANHLRSMVKIGQPVAAMAGVGEGKDTEGSEWIIKDVDNKDPRPVWISAWSGMNTLAQALWKVQHTRSAQETEEFVSKIRVYDVLGQDDAGAWIVKNFPQLTYIRNTKVYGWPESDEWYKENVQSLGALGSVFPNRIWASEGDTPAFLFCINNGLNAPEHIDYGGWGGRFSTSKTANIESMDWVKKSNLDEMQYAPYYMYGATDEGANAIIRWKDDIYADFRGRMRWTVTDKYAEANHHPVAVVNKDKTQCFVKIKAKAGKKVKLSTKGSFDPDGDALVYDWIFYKEPSTYQGTIDIKGEACPEQSRRASASFIVPEDANGKTIHIILRLSDKRNDSLCSYRRIVIDVE